MPLELISLTVRAHDPARVASFWADVLGREIVGGPHGPLLRGSATQVGLRFAGDPEPRVGPDRFHLHLTSADQVQQEETVAAALRLGASPLDTGQLPEEQFVVLADPEGNAFCVIEPGNSFLAGCGFLGELACDGTRDVGLFWSAALGWPLVWDHDEETAIQSPHGGTKIAWGGPPLNPRNGRQHLELAATGDPVAEVERLVSLGATRVGAPDGGTVVLEDPDGNEFVVTPAPG